jgi:galactose oxidase
MTPGVSSQSTMPQGQWGPRLSFPNVPIHTHVLPDGKVLMWGRRDTTDLDDPVCSPFVWDPADPTESADPTTAKTVSTSHPARADGTTVNLFCSGHVFLPDGRLLVAGGRHVDGDGLDQSCIYDPANSPGTWQPTATMLHGRWYPTPPRCPTAVC